MTNETEKSDAVSKSENLLVTTARAIGKAAGTVALTVVHHEGAVPAASTPVTAVQQVKRGKLPKHNKTRLPRRQKKALGKAQVEA
jgi:hypothetical protein